jgi:hypothetical protein
VKPDAAQALAAVDEDGGDAPEAPAGPSPREQLAQVLRLLDERTLQWRLDHAGREPDFPTYPGWEQFTGATTADGTPQAHGPRGSYLAQPPVNPLNQLSTVIVVDGPLQVADRMPVGQAGFVYSKADRCYWGTNGTGRLILVRGTEPAPAPPVTQPAPAVSPTAATTAPSAPAAQP